MCPHVILHYLLPHDKRGYLSSHWACVDYWKPRQPKKTCKEEKVRCFCFFTASTLQDFLKFWVTCRTNRDLYWETSKSTYFSSRQRLLWRVKWHTTATTCLGITAFSSCLRFTHSTVWFDLWEENHQPQWTFKAERERGDYRFTQLNEDVVFGGKSANKTSMLGGDVKALLS